MRKIVKECAGHPWLNFFRIILVVLVIFIAAPMTWLLISSFKSNNEVIGAPLSLPAKWMFGNYVRAFQVVIRYFMNSLLVVLCTLALCVTMSSMAAYGITRLKWRLSGAVKMTFMLGMMIPVHAILIPLMVLFTKLHLTDTYIGLIIPYTVFGFAQAIFIMCGFFASVPREMEEAAVIDGCSIWKCFWTVIIPISRPGLFTIGLFVFNGTWNELLVALIFTNSDAIKTLPVGLATFVGEYSTNYGPMLAAIVIAILPALILYCCFSNQIVGGLTSGAVKG